MVSRTPTKAPPSPKLGACAGPVTPSKPSPSPVARGRRNALRRRLSPSTTKRRGSPLKSLSSAPAAVAATFDRSLRTCRRRLLKLFTRLAVLGSPRKRRAAAAGFQRLRSFSPPPPPPPSRGPAVRAQSAALPPPPSPGRRTLFLDLDETLIHSQTDPPPSRFDFTVRPVIGGQAVTFYVAKRPGVEAFIRAAAESFEVVVFTAGLQEYASLVLDRLDPDGELFAHRLYRGACRDAGDGRLVKDLAATGRALDRAVIIDDNPNAYALQPENAIPVAPFVDDDNDQELQRVMSFLEIAAEYEDTREAIRCYQDLLAASRAAPACLSLHEAVSC